VKRKTREVSRYFAFLIWLKQFTEYPRSNRWLAGLHELLWTRHCGHDWRFARQMAWIYWGARSERRRGRKS
jgi:hypothetical protein